MFFKLLLLLSVFSLLSFCSDAPGGAGNLMPQNAEGINLITTDRMNDTAQIKTGDAWMSVSGGWANQSWQQLKIRLENKSDSPKQFDYTKVKMTGESGESLVLNFVLDTTDSGLDKNNQNPKEPKQIYSADSKQNNQPTLAIAPGETKILSLNFNNFTRRENALTRGKNVTVTVPDFQSGRLREIVFNCE